jgi:N-acetylglucosamine-6-phosphate deacetylase
MSDQIAFRGSVVLPDSVLHRGVVVCRDGYIEHVGNSPVPAGVNVIELGDKYIAPGFVDIHIHGGAGADYMDGTGEAAITINRMHAGHGTTVLFPTTTTGSFQQLSAMVDACQAVSDSWSVEKGARIAGVHFYGPYFAEDKVGCHPAEGRRDPDRSEYEFFLSKEIVRIATCASELPGAVDFFKYAHQAGCFITCGHSNACWSELETAYAAGMRHVDHFWCAMSSVSSLRSRFGTPMRGGMEQYVLWNKGMSTEVIADGEHLSDELLRFAYDMLGSQRLCLVTDANRAFGCPPGRYRFGSVDDGSWVVSDGKTVRAPDGSLASSMCGMDTMVKTMSRATGASVPELVRMASLTPAELTGIAKLHGSLEPGKYADLVVLSEKLDVEDVYFGGQLFRRAQ